MVLTKIADFELKKSKIKSLKIRIQLNYRLQCELVLLLPTIVTSHRKTVPSQAPSNELQNPGYKSNQTSLKRSDQPDEPIDAVNERKVSFGHQTAADITILKEISGFGDGKNAVS